MSISGYNANHPCQQQASPSSGPIVLREASAIQCTGSQFDGPIVLREASAISEAATLERMLNSTPERHLMFRTVTVTAAATHVDQQKMQEIAKKYGAPEEYVEHVWIAGEKKLHAFKWNGPAQGKDEIAIPHSQRSGIWESYQFKDTRSRRRSRRKSRRRTRSRGRSRGRRISLQAKMNLQFHWKLMDAMGISEFNATAKRALQMVIYEGFTVGEWWQVMFQAKKLDRWQLDLESLGYIGAQDLESKEDVLLAISQVLHEDFSIAQ